MSTTIFCKKLNKEGTALVQQPYPGTLGKRIVNEISKEAWGMWISHQTILINEYRLSLVDKEARDFLSKEMEKFLFGEGSEKPDAYRTPE